MFNKKKKYNYEETEKFIKETDEFIKKAEEKNEWYKKMIDSEFDPNRESNIKRNLESFQRLLNEEEET